MAPTPQTPSAPRHSSFPKLLIITRHTPLPWEDGSGSYLHDLARHLATRGFAVSILWLARHDHLRWQKLWHLPAAFSPAITLHLPGALRLGRRFFFPAVLWQPFRARALHALRRLLRPLGINPPRSRKPTTSSEVTQAWQTVGLRPRNLPVHSVPSAPFDISHSSFVIPSASPRPWASPPTPAELATIERFAAARRPDLVLANYAWMCPALALPAFRNTRRLCLAHDVGWQRAALSSPESAAELTRATEAAWLRSADLVVAISSPDATELRALAPHAQIVLSPKAAAAAPASPASDSDPHRLLFVGSDNAFNAEGLAWFLSSVWPTVLQTLPSASLHVCGSIDRLVTNRPDSVAFHGLVPSLDSHYAAAALVIVPLLRASGLNIKLIDAASAGRAVVTTSPTLVAAPFLRDSVAVADTAPAFAAEVLRLLSNPSDRSTLAARAQAAVQAHLSPEASYAPLIAALQATASNSH
jgi:glycosyltransferase involved in cell wall biosynthesis